MVDPVNLTASVIANLAFREFVRSTASELAKTFTEGAIAKIELLRQRVWDKLRSNPRAEAALVRLQQGSEVNLTRLTVYLQDEMEDDPEFAARVQFLVREINANRLQDYSSMVQSNYDSAKGFQTMVEGGTAYIGQIYYGGTPKTDSIQQLSNLIVENLQSVPNATVEELVERLKADDRIIQIDAGNPLAFQTFVDQGGTANVGIRLYDFDKEKLSQVLNAFWESLQPSGIPNNVPRSGVAKFVERQSELEELHTQLQQGNLLSITAINGMGGVGKTELAIQYTQRYADAYKGGITWLFAREFNVGSQVVGFAQSQLNLKLPEGLELPDQVAFCWRNWPEGEVLLVLDDVVNYSRDVAPYLPPPAFNRFKVVMTTRLTFEPPIQSISLDVLSPEQSLELLTILIGPERVQAELEIAKTLCVWLEYLPLGIELVGRYLLKCTDLSLSTLLFRLQEKPENDRQSSTMPYNMTKQQPHQPHDAE